MVHVQVLGNIFTEKCLIDLLMLQQLNTFFFKTANLIEKQTCLSLEERRTLSYLEIVFHPSGIRGTNNQHTAKSLTGN